MNKIKKMGKTIYDFYENNFFISCIKRGLSILLPVLFLGVIAYIIRYIPIEGYQNFMEKSLTGIFGKFFDIFIDICFNYFSLLSVISISYFVIKGKTDDFPIILMSIITSAFCLFILTETNLDGGIDLEKYRFGLDNIFLAIFIGCLVPTVIYYLTKKAKKLDSFSKTNQQIYKDMLKLSLPVIILVCLAFLIRLLVFVVLDCTSINMAIGKPFVYLINHIDIELIKGLTYQFFVQFFWVLCIDGHSVMEEAVLTGNIINNNFMLIFVTSTMAYGMIISIIIFSRYKKRKIYASFASAPAIFNINKAVNIGLPVILTPILFVPFLITPLVLTGTTYLFMYLKWLPAATKDVYNTMPAFFNAYLSTNSFISIILQLINISISFAIFMPFIRLHNKISEKNYNEGIKKIYREFEKAKQINNSTSIFNFNYSLGQISKTLLIRLVDDMRENNIETFFQPIANAKEAYVGMECLMRWNVDGIIVPPPLALEIAKESGLFFNLNYYLWERMCKNVSTKRTKAFVTFNVSVDCLERDDFEDKINGLFEKYSLDPNGFIIEITEETVLNHQFEVLEKIDRLKEKGFQFAIDDYGAGQTSMKYFQSNAFKLVKIDGDIVKNAENNPQNYDIIKSVKDLGKNPKFQNINFKILCEYVETQEQFEKLKSMNVDFYQGYYFDKAMCYEEIIKQISVRKQQNI